MSFEAAATVLRDPLILSRYDVEHSKAEERWVTLGHELSDEEAQVRIISARSATAHERRQYESG